MVSKAAKPPKLAPYPLLVGTATTGQSTNPPTTLGNTPSIPATTIQATPGPTTPPPQLLSATPGQTLVLENTDVRATFTSLGGGLRRVDLKQYPATIARGKKDAAQASEDVALNDPAFSPAFVHGGVAGLGAGQEFQLANLQLQMGRPRREVLHDLGVRTGVDDVRSLAAILIQADRFGSSIAQALRVQSDSMRTRRRQLAEEKAAKTAVQLIFPLVLFIFPAIFVVLVGPAAIQIQKNLLKGG